MSRSVAESSGTYRMEAMASRTARDGTKEARQAGKGRNRSEMEQDRVPTT
jgi:hypothetical protein